MPSVLAAIVIEAYNKFSQGSAEDSPSEEPSKKWVSYASKLKITCLSQY